jgi:phytoene desaturase (3,4-didehydrolycopene-forming)
MAAIGCFMLQFGGRCQSHTTPDGFRFDTGPSLLLFPGIYKDTFADLGSRLEDHAPITKVAPAAYRVFFSGASSSPISSSSSSHSQSSSTTTSSSSLDLLYDVQQMADQLDKVEAGAGGHPVLRLLSHTCCQACSILFFSE